MCAPLGKAVFPSAHFQSTLALIDALEYSWSMPDAIPNLQMQVKFASKYDKNHVLEIGIRFFEVQFLDPYVTIQNRMTFCLQLNASRHIRNALPSVIATVNS